MKTKEQKKEILEKISDKLSKAKIVIFTSFMKEGEKGLSVGGSQELRRSLREIESDYIVSKKRLIGVALEKSDYSGLVDVKKFDGSIGVVFGYDDVVSPSRSVHMFSKKNPSLRLLGALMDKEFIDEGRLNQLATLPTKEVLLSRMMGMIQYPLSGLASVLQGNTKNLLLLLSNIKK